MNLSELIKQEHFSSLSQEALLNVIVTSNWIMGELNTQMAPFGITPAQYNVLRILRGSYPEAMTCTAIGERLLDRTPDTTRLLNRLDRNGLIRRERSADDRRVVKVVITDAGMKLLDEIQPPIDRFQESIMRYVTPEEQRRLIALLERLRTDQGL